MHVDINLSSILKHCDFYHFGAFGDSIRDYLLGLEGQTIGDLFGRNIMGKNFFGELQSVDRNNFYQLGTFTRDIHAIQ